MLMNNKDFGKIMENMRKHRDIKLLKKEAKRNYLASDPNYHTKDFFFFRKFIGIINEKYTDIHN